MAQHKFLQTQDESDLESDHKIPSLSSALEAFIYSLHTRFCGSLDMKELRQMEEQNRLTTAVLDSQLQLEMAKAKLETVEYEIEAEEIHAKTKTELAGYESETRIHQAIKNLEQAKHELDLMCDPRGREAKKDVEMLKIEKCLSDLRASIREHDRRGQDKETATTSKSAKTPDEWREAYLARLKVNADDEKAIEQWRKERLSELDREKQEELDRLEESSLSDEDKKKRELEIEARYANRRHKIITTKLR